MSPITHFLVSWDIANAVHLKRKERVLVTIAGVVPDLDGIGMVAEVFTRYSDQPLDWGSRYHHLLCHNIGFALVVAVVTIFLSSRRFLTTGLAMVAFHLHLLGDLIGARGPEGYQWPIPYLLPFSDSWQLTWRGQWALNAWPNFLVTGAALFLAGYLAWRRGYSPLEMISTRADRGFVRALRRRFGHPSSV